MVSREYHHVRHVSIIQIIRNRIIDLDHAFIPVDSVTWHTLANCSLKREVHDARKIAVEAVLIRMVCLPVCELRDIA